MTRLSAIFILLFIVGSSLSAQVRKFQQNEVIDAGSGMKLEILNCRGEGDNEECEVIYYTDKMQQGKRQWEKTSKIKELEQNAKANKSFPGKSSELSPKESVKNIVTQDSTAIKDSEIVSAKKIPDELFERNLRNTNESKRPVLSANTTTAKVYTLEECFQLALKRNLGIKKAQNNISSNIIDHKTAQYNLLPSVSYNLGHYFSFGKNIDPVTNAFVNENFSGGYTALGLQLQLFSGFGRLNTIKQTSYIIASAEAAMKRTELELLTNITLTYARLLLNKDQLQIERNNIESTTKQLAVITEKINVGRLTKYEAYAFDARLNTELANIITIQNDSTIAAQDLKHFLNIDYKEPVDIASIDTTVLSKIFYSTINTADFIDTILINHPAIKQVHLEEQVAQYGLKIAKSNLYPTLSAGANVASNYNVDQTNYSGQKIPLTQQLNDNMGKNVNISLRIPIFSQMQNSNLIKKEKINISNAQINVQETKNLIETNTLQLINDFNAARQKYTATKLASEQTNLSYSMYEEKYKLGQLSSLELLTSGDLVNTYTSKYVQAKLELFFRFQLLTLLKNL